MVYGPGFPAEGKDLLTGCGRTDTVVRCPYWLWEEFFTVAAGTHTWIVAPYWKTENGIMLDVDSGARVTATVPPAEAGVPTVAPAAPSTTTSPGGKP